MSGQLQSLGREAPSLLTLEMPQDRGEQSWAGFGEEKGAWTDAWWKYPAGEGRGCSSGQAESPPPGWSRDTRT